MKTALRMTFALSLGALLLAPAAEARARRKTGTRSPHHCMKDGAEVPGAHKRDCRAGGGKWLKVKPANAPAK